MDGAVLEVLVEVAGTCEANDFFCRKNRDVRSRGELERGNLD